MERLIEFLNGFNFQTIISMGAIVWYFTGDIKKELGSKIDKLETDVQNMNKRLSRIEGTVYGEDIYKYVED